MEQPFILGADFCQEYAVVLDFSRMLAKLAIGSTTVQVPLLREQLGLELNECKELASGKLENFSSQVSYKQYRKLLRKYKQPATVVVVRNIKGNSHSVSKVPYVEINNL